MPRVQKIIAQSGICSRRKAEELIQAGKVTVNGEIVTIGAVAEDSDNIIVNGKEINKEEKIYIMLNKPAGYVTANSDDYADKLVTDLVDVPQRVFPVGRLDKDVSGLLLLTNDGDWGNTIIHPRFKKEKEYLARCDDMIPKDILQKMNGVTQLNDGKLQARVYCIKHPLYRAVVVAGRHKIVKRLFGHYGFRVKQLKRVRVGDYKIGNLKIGEWKFIKP